MFSGIVAFQSRVEKVSEAHSILTLRVLRPKRLAAKVGESIAVNGICSTVVGVSDGVLTFEYMSETLRKTNAGALCAGDEVNLEPSLQLGETVSGHFVLGHVDGTGVLRAISAEGSAKCFRISIPKNDMRYIVSTGSVTVDGVGLTVAAKEGSAFTVSLTPYTLEHTNLRLRRVRDKVNIEYDIFAKYLNAIVRSPEKSRLPSAGRHRSEPL